MNSKNYRNFSKPLGAIIEERAKLVKEHFTNSMERTSLSSQVTGFHYGSHYSTPGIILYFMLRIMPFSSWAKDLQGGKFDLSDRLFHSIQDCWHLSTTLDNKEMIPEFFFLPEFLLNLNNFDFGKTQTEELVKDVILPVWSYNDPRFFVLFNRKAIESHFSSTNIHEWINLIFGYKQRGKYAEEALNLFYNFTYEKAVDINNYNEKMMRNSILDQINEYGQTPKQLFKKPHPEKKKLEKSNAFFYSAIQLKNLSPPLIIADLKIINRIDNNNNIFIDDFNIKGETLKYFFRNMVGINSFIRIPIENIEKNSENGINPLNVAIKGNSLFADSSKMLNWSNCYGMFMIINTKNFWGENIQVFNVPGEFSSIDNVKIEQSKKWMAVANNSGVINIYRIIKIRLKKNDSNLFNKRSKSFNKKEKNDVNKGYVVDFSCFDKFEINSFEINCLNTEENYNFRFLNKFEMENKICEKNQGEKVPSIIKIVSNFKGKPENYFNDEILLKKFKKNNNSNENLEKKLNLELYCNLKGHKTRILSFEFALGFNILISIDYEGIICIWKIEKSSPLHRKFYICHYSDQEIFKQVFYHKQEENNTFNQENLFYNKTLVKREKVKQISICEENGDFVFASQNYFSVYTINGVLISIKNRRENNLAKISSCLITSVITI